MLIGYIVNVSNQSLKKILPFSVYLAWPCALEKMCTSQLRCNLAEGGGDVALWGCLPEPGQASQNGSLSSPAGLPCGHPSSSRRGEGQGKKVVKQLWKGFWRSFANNPVQSTYMSQGLSSKWQDSFCGYSRDAKFCSRSWKQGRALRSFKLSLKSFRAWEHNRLFS